MHAYELNGIRILEFSVNDAEVSAASDSSALISLAIEHQAALVILPASEVHGAFFQLKTGFAGDLIQKFVKALFAAGNPVSQCLKLGVHTSYLVSEAMR
jgi:Domain of unknown function (DUF4180)